MESSINEFASGDALIYQPTPYWSLPNVINCPDNPNLKVPLKIKGPFGSQTPITYRNTLSFHDYIVIKFLLIKMNWDQNTFANLTVADINGVLLYNQIIGSSPNVPLGTSYLI